MLFVGSERGRGSDWLPVKEEVKLQGVTGKFILKRDQVGLVPVMLEHLIDEEVKFKLILNILYNLFCLGGASFGPKPRDFSFTLPLKLRWLAFRSALSEKYRLGQVSVISSQSLQLPSHKTAEVAKLLDGFSRPDGSSRKMLILGIEPVNSSSLRNLMLATRTIDGAQVDYIQVDQEDLIKKRYKLKQHQRHPVTAYHLIKYHHVCITPEAIEFYKSINERI